MNLEQLRKQAKDLVREARAGDTEATARLGDLPLQLASAQLVIAREQGFTSWSKLKAYAERLSVEQPFRTDMDYYEGRAEGIATVRGVGIGEARTRPCQPARLLELGRAATARGSAQGRYRAADALHAGIPRGRGRRP